MHVTPQQRRALALPVWQGPTSVTKHDVVSSRVGDGLPGTLASAQRVLCALNGGIGGSMDRCTDWTPDAIPSTRMSYRLSRQGQEVATAEVERAKQARIDDARRLTDSHAIQPLATSLFGARS